MTSTLLKRKWLITDYVDNKKVTLDDVTDNQSVVITNCKHSVVTIAKPCTQITLEKCSDVGVIFVNASSCEVVNCQSTQVQFGDDCPIIQVEQSAKITLFVTRARRATVVIRTSLCTEVNIVTPDPDDEFADPEQAIIPQQFETKYSGNQWQTTPVKY